MGEVKVSGQGQSFRGGISISPGTYFGISDKLELRPVSRLEQKVTVGNRLTSNVSPRLTVSQQSGLELFIVRVRVQMELAVAVAVLILVVPIRPDEPMNISSLCAVDVIHAPLSVCAKDDAA